LKPGFSALRRLLIWGGALTDGDKMTISASWYTADGKRKKLSEEDLRALYLLKHGGGGAK
jgi:hypothetical protein